MSDTWSWDDVVWDDAPAAGRRTLFYGGNKRQDGSTRSRFVGTSAHASREAAALSADHLAVRRGRTLFPTTVISPEDAPRLLVGGHNSAKIGAKIEKGPWRGLHVYTLTLEERATCPTSCHLWRECYGNAMPLVRRHAADDTLIPTLDAELRNKARWHGARGFAVRLHVLGDFYSQVYLLAWLRWMNEMPHLRVWGYTAHRNDSPIGAVIARMNEVFAGRWAFRFSVPHGAAPGPWQATTIWRPSRGGREPEGLVCPAQTKQTASCGTCGLCWSPTMRDTRIAFVGHGMSRRGVASK